MPILIAASGPLAAKLAGRQGDGLIVTSGKDPELYVKLLDAAKEGAEKMDKDFGALRKMIEIKVSYDRDRQHAHDACAAWAALALSGDEKAGIEDPIEMERAAEAAADRAHTRFIVSDDPEEVVDAVRAYVDLGLDELVFHLPGDDQTRQLDAFCADVLPRLREAFG